jgi:DivIVA domain-containing protein
MAMQLTVAAVRDVQFRQSWKGYDTVEVDDFLDAVATGVAVLHERLLLAQQRNEVVGAAQTVSPVASVRSESDESIRRTLVLAQRAADLVVSEAKSVADRIVADAHGEAAAITTASRAVAEQTEQQARVRAEQILTEATAMAERQTATRAAELHRSLDDLIEEQGRRRFEVEQLRLQVETYRGQLRAELEAQMRRLESIPEPPALALLEPVATTGHPDDEPGTVASKSDSADAAAPDSPF